MKQSKGGTGNENRKGEQRLLRLQKTRHGAVASGHSVRVDLYDRVGRGKTAPCQLLSLQRDAT